MQCNRYYDRVSQLFSKKHLGVSPPKNGMKREKASWKIEDTTFLKHY